ncbi:LysR family transcriptional regulator [Candidatus Gracilibacteria bacterium]|jgi:DNA-binding transcriptional LysR family regulator|nr:LysR family transcriptional regulator [Candidatus Gracilibacteria bacterium]NJM90239.1 LysR family transcriptional regulator [Hydrococcus sp. RU_2_2]
MSAIAPGIKISQLRALVAIADWGKFSEAALHLELSQSAISHAIATLEEELGIVLMTRGRHGATLTPIGEQIASEARQILELLASIYQKADRAKGLQGGQVRIASVRSVATHILPEIVVAFRNKFPTINVAIAEYTWYSEVEQTLREGRADIGFTSLPTSDEFETWKILQDEFIVLLPPETPHSDRSLSWEELANYPMILNPHNYQHHKMVADRFGQFGQTLKVAYEVKEDSTIISMVQRGLGATIIPQLAAKPIPEGLQVKRLPVPLERAIGAAILANALHPPAVFAFLEAIEQYQKVD